MSFRGYGPFFWKEIGEGFLAVASQSSDAKAHRETGETLP
jgi:hypothetical protein